MRDRMPRRESRKERENIADLQGSPQGNCRIQGHAVLFPEPRKEPARRMRENSAAATTGPGNWAHQPDCRTSKVKGIAKRSQRLLPQQ